MFIQDFFNTDMGKDFNKLAKQSCTYNAKYIYWRDELFERVMRLFVWENTGSVKPKEIEQRLLLNGHVGITIIPKDKSELTAMYGSFNGVTKYNDEWKNYTVRCPIYSATKPIFNEHNKNGKVVVIDNNALRNPIYPLIHHYATLLAHTEVTYINSLINARDSGGAPVVSTEKQKQSVNDYNAKRFNGQYGVIVDSAFLGIEYATGSANNTQQEIKAIYECRNRILKDFYSDIGVRSAFEKRSNTITEEVEADTSLLLLNLSDMFESRKKALNL